MCTFQLSSNCAAGHTGSLQSSRMCYTSDRSPTYPHLALNVITPRDCADMSKWCIIRAFLVPAGAWTITPSLFVFAVTILQASKQASQQARLLTDFDRANWREYATSVGADKSSSEHTAWNRSQPARDNATGRASRACACVSRFIFVCR